MECIPLYGYWYSTVGYSVYSKLKKIVERDNEISATCANRRVSFFLGIMLCHIPIVPVSYSEGFLLCPAEQF